MTDLGLTCVAERDEGDFGWCADAGGEDGLAEADVDVEVLFAFLV